MPSSITAEEIFSILQKEKKTGELLPLEPDFYKKAKVGESMAGASENGAENFRKVLLLLREKRTQKILNYIAFGRSLPHPTPEEEERLYIRIKNIITEEEKSTGTRLMVFEDTPEIITPEGKKIGPFHKNEIVEAGMPDAEFMINNNIAKKADE